MSNTSPRQGAGRRLAPAPVAWTTVAVLAALMAYADGFVLTSIQVTVGIAERAQEPFATWLRNSTLMLPVFALAVLAALAFARHRLGPALRAPRKVVAAALLIAAAGGVVGTAEVVAGVAYDYHLQAEQLRSSGSVHDHVAAGAPTAAPGTCTGACSARQEQLAVDLKAARFGSAAVLGANVVLVGWVLAARGGPLETRRRGGTAARA